MCNEALIFIDVYRTYLQPNVVVQYLLRIFHDVGLHILPQFSVLCLPRFSLDMTRENRRQQPF
jgi:hypothetical protein